MADQTEDLGVPTKPIRQSPKPSEPPGVNNLALSLAVAGPMPATVATPHLPNPGTQAPPGPAVPRQKTEQSAGADSTIEARKLIVGNGITLSGEINCCDRLIVEGIVVANLQSCQSLTITESGHFEGNATIDDVDVYGRFEGDLAVRKRLLIRAGGQVSGTITYGEIEIEAGGRISGSIQMPRT